MSYCMKKSLYKLNAKFSYIKPAIIKMYFLDGRMEEVMMDKITLRIEQLCEGLNMDFIDPVI